MLLFSRPASSGLALAGTLMLVALWPSNRICAQERETSRFRDLPSYQSLTNLVLTNSASEEVAQTIADHAYPRAEGLLIESIKQQPQAFGLLEILGGVFFLDGKYLNCASALEKANTAGVLDEPSRFTLAMAYVNLERIDLAGPELGILVRAAPENSLYRYWLGRVDFINQKYGSSIENLKLAISVDPHSSRAYDLLGLCYEALHHPQEAVDEFKNAVRVNRESPQPSPWPPFDCGEQLYKLGEYVEAEPYVKESVGYEPNFAKAHFQLGLVYEKLGHDDDAINELRAAAVIDKNYPEPYFALFRILRKKGDWNSARDAARQFEILSAHRQK